MIKYTVAMALMLAMAVTIPSAQAGGYRGYGGHHGGGWGHAHDYGGWRRPYCPPRQQIVYVEPRHPRHHGWGHRPHYQPVYGNHHRLRPRESFGFFVRY